MRRVPGDVREHEVAPRVAAVMREVAAELASGHVRSFEVLLAYGPPGAPIEPAGRGNDRTEMSSAA